MAAVDRRAKKWPRSWSPWVEVVLAHQPADFPSIDHMAPMAKLCTDAAA